MNIPLTAYRWFRETVFATNAMKIRDAFVLDNGFFEQKGRFWYV